MKFLIIDKMHHSIIPLLKEIGCQSDYKPEIKKNELVDIIPQYDGIILRSKIDITENILNHAKKLSIICRAGAGLDNLDIEAIKEKKIVIINAPEGNKNALAEHTLGLLLSMLNNIPQSFIEIKNSIWNREGNRGEELENKTVGIIGYGHMGSAFAKKLKHLGCKILVYDKYKSDFGDEHIIETDMNALFENTDILSLHIPLNNQTQNMVNYHFLSKFHKPIWIINTSRGSILPNKELLKGLSSNKVIAAALDVLENEKIDYLEDTQKLEFEALLRTNRVIITPHVGGWSNESYERINKILIDKLKITLASTHNK